MADTLVESIELVVEQPTDGHFYWVLCKREGAGAKPVVVEGADSPMPTFGTAMMAGIAALQRRADARAPGACAPVVTDWVDRDTDYGPPTVQ